MFVPSVYPFSIQTITIPVTIFPLLAVISTARHMFLEAPLSFCSEIKNSDTGKKARFKNLHNIVHVVYTCSTLNLTAVPQHRVCSIQAPVQKRSNTSTCCPQLKPQKHLHRTSWRISTSPSQMPYYIYFFSEPTLLKSPSKGHVRVPALQVTNASCSTIPGNKTCRDLTPQVSVGARLSTHLI